MVDKVRVLIVDASKGTAPSLIETLEGWGHEAETVTSSDEALEHLESSGADVVLIAVEPDQAEELDDLKALAATESHVPILAIVDADDPAAVARVYEAGAADFVCRPVSDAELRARLTSHCHLGAVFHQLRRKEDHSRVMLALTRTLSSSLEFEAILFEVAKSIAEVIQVERCSIVLTGGDPSKGYVVASSEDPGVRDLPIDLAKYPEVEKVLEDGKALVIDVGSDPLLDSVRSQLPKGGPRTSAIFPITHEARPMGVLFLRFKARREELADRELDFCQTVANATAISLRNARIVSALKVEQARISHAASEAERRAEALSHYVDFFESSADGMLVVDPKGAVLYANPRISTLTGRSEEELTSGKLTDLVVDDELPVVARLLDEFARGAYPRGLDLRFTGAGGEALILSVSASSTVRIANGVLLILRDVTAARATEAELRRTTEFLEGLIAQSLDAIIASDMSGRLVLFNPAAERILAYPASEVLGNAMIEQMYPEGVARDIMRKLRSDDHGGAGHLEQTRATIVAKDGSEIPISMTGGVIYEDNEPRATFGIFTDLRPILQIENDLARTRLELMEREREAIAAQLAGAAAHELNQPLTFVMASVELLRRKLGEGTEHGETVDTILAEAERMAQIVRKVGRITHYETKAYVGSTRILDLDAAASSEESAAPVSNFSPFEEDEHEDTFVGQIDLSSLDDDEETTSGGEVLAAEPPPSEGPLDGDVVAALRSGRGDSSPPPDGHGSSPPPPSGTVRAVFSMNEEEEPEVAEDTNPSAVIETGEPVDDTHPTGMIPTAREVAAAEDAAARGRGGAKGEPARASRDTISEDRVEAEREEAEATDEGPAAAESRDDPDRGAGEGADDTAAEPSRGSGVPAPRGSAAEDGEESEKAREKPKKRRSRGKKKTKTKRDGRESGERGKDGKAPR